FTHHLVKPPVIADDDDDSTPQEVVIVFDERPGPGDKSVRPLDIEYLRPAHKDFWFHTNQAKSFSLGLQRKSCSCVEDPEVGRFAVSDEQWDATVAGFKFVDVPSVIHLGCHLIRFVDSVSFIRLGEAMTSPRVKLPGTPAGKVPRPYILRFNWKATRSTLEQL